MIKNLNKNIILLTAVAFLINTVPVLGDTVSNEGNNFSYLFHLYYDNGKLSADKDFKFAYDPIPEEYVPKATNIPNSYKGEVVNVLEKIVGIFQFDPKQDNPNFTKGKISVKAPYFADAKEVNFYSPNGNKILTVSVKESSFCNDNNVCNGDVGENNKNCPNDCKLATPTPTPSPETPVSKDETSIAGIPYIYIYISTSFITAVILIFVILRLRKRKNLINESR